MGMATPHALGRQRKFFAKAETTYATGVTPAASDAIKVLKTNMAFKQAREDRMDSRASASVLESITGRKEVTWGCEGYLIPSGTAGTAPDIGVLIKAIMGIETVNAVTSVVYTLTASQSVRASLSLLREWSVVASERCVGAVPHTMNLKASGGERPRISFEGFASDLYGTGRTTLNGALSGGETSVPVTDGSFLEAGSLISIGSSTGPHTVTAVSTNTLTVTPSVSGAQSDLAEVIPYVPSETTAGSPVAGITGSFVIAGTTIPVTGFELSIKTNDAPVDDEAFQSTVTDYIPGFREVTGKFDIRVRRDLYKWIRAAKLFGVRDLAVTIGATAGSILTVDMNYTELDFGELEDSEAEVVKCSIPFKCKGSSGEDEVSLTFT